MKTLLLFIKLNLLFVIIAFGQAPWIHVPSPNPSPAKSILRGISGTSENDIWAVGHFETTPAGGNYSQANLIIHRTGNSWTVANAPVPSGSTGFDDLWDVHSVSVNDVWAVGHYAGVGSGSQSQILHYDGNYWSQVSFNLSANNHFLWSIDAISGNDIWAVGGKSGTVTDSCLTLHYNGSSWSEIPVSPVGQIRNRFLAVDGIASNDVWAVGSWGPALGNYHYLAMHWDGNNWNNFPMPSQLTGNIGELTDVHMITSNDVWALGGLTTGGMVLIHWDGTSWTEVTPQVGGGALVARSPNDVLAVGERISHWDGFSWQIVDSLNYLPFPGLSSAIVLPSGEIWAAGRTVDLNNIFETLVMRSGTIVGVTEFEMPNTEVMVNPNPYINNFKVYLNSSFTEKINATFFSIDGKLISEKQFQLISGDNELNFNPEYITSGVYFIKLNSENLNETLKVIKK